MSSEEPRLLTKLEYLRLLSNAASPISAAQTAEQILGYAAEVWQSVGLKQRKLRNADIIASYRDGARHLFHLKAYPRKQPDTVMVIVFDPTVSEVFGHILIDLGAENSTPRLDCPSSEYEGNPTIDEIESLLAQIHPDDDDPFAIMETGDGTYLQTLRGDDGYVLEHQLVNTSNHYETINLATFEQVVEAFRAYGFGGTDWLESFDWRRQDLG
jgi:hypothetical protein